MASLVAIPWQPGYKLTPQTLTRLQDASRRAGHNIRVDDAWRSYAEQKGYWDAYQAYLHGGPYANIASNPDTGQRNHMRGAAVDIVNRADRAAMLAAGFLPDPDEWWHFNDPAWQSMPIIPTDTSISGGGAIAIDTSKKGKRMWLEWDTGGTGWLVLGPCWIGLPSMQIYNLFRRVIISDQTKGQPDTFLRAEVDMMNSVQVSGYQGVIKGSIVIPTFNTVALSDAIVTALNKNGITAKLAPGDKELVTAIDAGFVRSMKAYATAAAQEVTTTFDPAKLADAVAQSLQKTGIVTTVDTKAVTDAVSQAIARATAAVARATALEPSTEPAA